LKFAHLVLVASLAVAASTASAQVSVNINVPGVVQLAPPPPRYEVIPGPRPDQIWVPGRWHWTGREYAWRAGFWQGARPDYAYLPGEWVRVDGGWRWREGGWRPGPVGHGGERFYDDHHHGERYEHDGRYHCPPGQEKKGRC
jgi:hypothetical protein